MRRNSRLPLDPSELDGLMPKLRGAAAKIMINRHVAELRQQGAPMVGISIDGLVHHAVICLYENKPPIRIYTETIWKYCVKRMDNKVRATIQRQENRPNLAKFVEVAPTDFHDDGDAHERDQTVVVLSDHISPDAIVESADTLRHFISYLRQNKPHLVDLFHMQIFENTEPSDERDRFEISIKKVYELRKELARAKRNFLENEKYRAGEK